MIRNGMWMLVLGAALAVPSFSRAQERPDPAAMRERFMTAVKERIGATEDEWKVLAPKIEKVSNARRDAGGFGGFGRRTGGNNAGGTNPAPATDQPQSATAKASSELRTALENKETPAEEISKKLAALREARTKAKADLAAAQKELKEVLTQRQEAVLVTMGMLE